MKIEVSDGEIVDKYSILCLKLDLITHKDKKKQVQHEKDLLHDYATLLIGQWPMYYRLLFHVNKQIWHKTDEMKAFPLPDDPEGFARLSSDIFSLNDQRFRLKRIFNTSSDVKEQKSYADKTLHIFLPDYNLLQTRLDELISRVLTHDKILITLDKEKQHVIDTIHHWIPPFCVSFVDDLPTNPSIPSPDATTLSIIHHFTNSQA